MCNLRTGCQGGALVSFGLLFSCFACVCTHVRAFDVDLDGIMSYVSKAFVSVANVADLWERGCLQFGVAVCNVYQMMLFVKVEEASHKN